MRTDTVRPSADSPASAGPRPGGGPAGRRVLPLVCALMTGAVLAPVLAPGYVLVYDMQFVPRQSLVPESLGLGTALPRAVPVDAVVALLTTVVPGQLVQKVALCAALFMAALGAGRLVPTSSTPVRLIAAVGYGWNAYVAERLFLGHWSLLLGYASLPWVVGAGLALRRPAPDHGTPDPVARRRAWAVLVLGMGVAALTPTGGLLAAAAAAAAAGRRSLVRTVGLAVVLNAPWWLAAALHPSAAGSDPAGVAAFAARGEGPAGPVLTLLGLGGVWNAETVPASRDTLLVLVTDVGLALVALYGLRTLSRRWGAPEVRALTVLAAVGLVLGCAGALPGTGAALRWAVLHLPGAGLLRDGQKWIAWWAVLKVVAVAVAAEDVLGRLRAPGMRAVLFAGLVVLPVALLPDLAWGGFGRLSPVRYPSDWAAVRAVLSADQRPGDVLPLPLGAFRRFAWNDGRTMLDPACRAMPRTVLTDDDLLVDGVRVHGENPRMAGVREALAHGEPLGARGIGWVLVEHGTPGVVDPRVLAALSPAYDGVWLSLYRVPGPVTAEAKPPAAGVAVLVADFAALVALLVAPLQWLLSMGRVRKSMRRNGDTASVQSGRSPGAEADRPTQRKVRR